MKKKLTLITLLALLGTGINLHAGCWVPESYTVKNHYKGKDGGYVEIRAMDPNNIYQFEVEGIIVINDPKTISDYKRDQKLKESLPPTDPTRKKIEGRWTGYKPEYRENTFYLRLKGKHGKYLRFQPAGFQASYDLSKDKTLLSIIKKYWPHIRDIKISLPERKRFLCYITTTDAAFESWKENLKYLRPEERKKRLEQQKKIRTQQAEEMRQKEIEERMKIHLQGR